jgi:hypothetical protein
MVSVTETTYERFLKNQYRQNNALENIKKEIK